MILLMSRECSENWPINVQNNPLFALNPFKPMAIVHVFLNLNAPWSIDNPQRCPWNFNDFSLTLFIVITCTQNVLFPRPVSMSYYGTSNWNFVCRSCKMWMSCLTERSYRPLLMQGGQTVSTPGSLCSAPLKRRTIHSSSSPCPKEALMV